MKTPRIATTVTAALMFALAGCIFISRVPSELGSVNLTQVSSPSVAFQWCTIERQKDGGGFLVRGYVTRKPNAQTTAHTQLHIRFLDMQGHLLHEEIGGFEPREIKDWKVRGEPEPYASYAVPFKDVPNGTTGIEVRAQDDSK